MPIVFVCVLLYVHILILVRKNWLQPITIKFLGTVISCQVANICSTTEVKIVMTLWYIPLNSGHIRIVMHRYEILPMFRLTDNAFLTLADIY